MATGKLVSVGESNVVALNRRLSVMMARLQKPLGLKGPASGAAASLGQARSRSLLKDSLLKLVKRALGMNARRRNTQAPAPLPVFPRRILIVKFAGLGDAILVRGVTVSLRSKHPELELGILACRPALPVLPKGLEARVHLYNMRRPGEGSILRTLFEMLRTVSEIRKMRYEAAIDFEQGTSLTAAFLTAAAIPVRIGGYLPGVSDARAAMLTHALVLRETDSMLTSFLRLARILDPELSVAAGDLYLPYGAPAKRRAEELWQDAIPKGTRVVALHLGPLQWGAYRRWPLERFVDLIDRIRAYCESLAIILTGTDDERPLAEQFSRTYRGKSINLCGRCSVEETAAVVERCDLVVSCDTGVMHLAAAMGAPTVGLFGPNTPRHWAPVGPRAAYVVSNGLPCSPCINNYRNLRPKECFNEVKSACMLEIHVEDVVAAARRVVHDGWLR